MAVYIAIPKLGMGMIEATLVEWRLKEGDRVEQGDIVLEIETEKVEWEIEAAASGFLHILVEEGSNALVSRVVGLIAETKEELEALQKEPPREIFATVTGVEEVPAGAPQTETTEVKPVPASVSTTEEEKHIRISPVARKMAEEHTIDITAIAGTGPGGRIVREDIEKAVEVRGKVVETREKPEVTPDVYQGKRVKASIPLKGMRKAIAEHMHRSLSVSAQLTVMGELDMTETVKLRESLAKQEEAIGTRITYTDIFVFVIARALKDNPGINCSLIDNEIKVWEDINIGVAVAIGEEGLIVPVIKNADRKSLVEISQAVKALVEKAKGGKLMPDDVTGGTFTLTSIGATGVSIFQTPIINQPESAILGTGPITDKPVVRDGQIVIASVMPYSLTFDHRVINGFGGEVFMIRVRELLQTPGLLLL